MEVKTVFKLAIKNRILFFSISIIILFSLTGCKSSQTTNGNEKSAITNTKDLKDNILDLRNLTPAKVLEKYINSLEAGNVKDLNALFSKEFLNTVDNGSGYSSIQKQNISNVKIKIDEQKKSTDNESYYILTFVLDKESNPPFFMQGIGDYMYFVRLVNEDNCWKIDGLATSP